MEEGMLVCAKTMRSVIAGALLTMIGGIAASDEAKYPDLKGYWRSTNRG